MIDFDHLGLIYYVTQFRGPLLLYAQWKPGVFTTYAITSIMLTGSYGIEELWERCGGFNGLNMYLKSF